MTAAPTAALAIAAGAALRRLRRGDAAVGTFRAELVGVLSGVVTSAGNRPQPLRLDTDPCALIDLAVELCRDAGVSGLDMAARFNDAVERRRR